MKEAKMPGTKLYVGNFSYSINDSQLKELFASHGEVKEVTIIAGKGFGFVEMADADSAAKAKEALNGTQWEGRTIRVDEARPMTANKQRGGFQDRNRSFGNRDNRGPSRGYRR